MTFPRILLPVLLTVGVVAAGAGVITENNAKNDQLDDLRSVVTALAPDAIVDSTDLRGFPQTVRRANHEIPTAYVNLTADGQQMQWIVQDLHTDTRRLGLLDVLVTVDLPGAQPTPVTDDSGAYTDRGTVDGTTVAYGAHLDGPDLIVTADGAEISRTPAPVDGGLRVDKAFVSDAGLRVQLTARNLTV